MPVENQEQWNQAAFESAWDQQMHGFQEEETYYDESSRLVGDLLSRPRDHQEPPQLLAYQNNAAQGFGRGQRYNQVAGLSDKLDRKEYGTLSEKADALREFWGYL